MPSLYAFDLQYNMTNEKDYKTKHTVQLSTTSVRKRTSDLQAVFHESHWLQKLFENREKNEHLKQYKIPLYKQSKNEFDC